MSLRARVAVAAAAAIVLALALLVIAVPNLLARDLRSDLDDSLRRRAADVARLNATVPTQLTETGALEGGGLLVQVVDRSGRIVARSSALGGRVLPVARRCATGSRVLADDRLGRRPDPGLHGAAGRARRGRSGGRRGGRRVRPGRDRAHPGPHADADRRLRAGRGACSRPALATLLTRRALRPLARLSAGARAIGALRRRLAAAAGAVGTTRSANWRGR